LTVHHFFVRKEAIQFPLAIIDGREHHHLQRVLRLKKGEKIRIFNEKGELFSGSVEKIEGDKTTVRLESCLESESLKVAITVAPACLKTKMMDWLVQKMTELRVMMIVPLLTKRTVVRLEGEGSVKVARWRRLAIEAAKQVQSPFFPEIRPPLRLENFIVARPERKKYYLSERGGALLREVIQAELESGLGNLESAIICAGPEGGWEKEEEELLQAHQFLPISLGPRIFRAETALFTVASVLAHLWNV